MVAPMMTETRFRRRSTGRAPHGSARPWPARRRTAHRAGLAPILMLSLAVALGQGLLAQPAAAQGDSEAQPPAGAATTAQRQIQDWTVRCDAPTAGSMAGPCYMVQDITAPTGEGRIAQVLVGHFGPERLLGAVVFVPLGTRLPPGLLIGVDANDPRRFPYQLCSPNGCRAQIALDEAFLNELKAGVKAEAVFEDANGRKLAVQISLRGFTAALDEIS